MAASLIKQIALPSYRSRIPDCCLRAGNLFLALLLLSAGSVYSQALQPPNIVKSFTHKSIPFGSTTLLTFVVTNPNQAALSGVKFTDYLPDGLELPNPPTVGHDCLNGTVTAPPAGWQISLSGATLPGLGSCTVHVNVTGIGVGHFTNTVYASATGTANGPTASDVINIVAAPTFSKSFLPSIIALNKTSVLTFTVGNPVGNPVAITGLTFDDPLVNGLLVASVPNIQNTCNGTVNALPGSTIIRFTGGSVNPGASCTIKVNVTSNSAGIKTNKTSEITANETLPCNAAQATLTVVSPPTIAKSFFPSVISVRGNSKLTFTVTNSNDITTLSGISLTDNLPGGLILSNPVNVSNTCGGSVTALPGGTSVTLSNGVLQAKKSCTIEVNVTDNTIGPAPCRIIRNNVTDNVNCSEGGQGNQAQADLTVVLHAPPVMTKSFTPSRVLLNGLSTMTFTLTNPSANDAALTDIQFTDTLPAGVIIATPNNLTSSCGGSVTATAGSQSFQLTGGTIPAKGSCAISLTVKGTTLGAKLNSTSIVNSSACEAGSSAQATLYVEDQPVAAPLLDGSGFITLLLLLAASGSFFLFRMGRL